MKTNILADFQICISVPLILSLLTSLQEKSALLKISAQAFEAGDFLNIFSRFLGF